MVDGLQAILGLLVLIGFWWGVFALIRLFEPPRVRRPTPPAVNRPPLRAGPVSSGSETVPSRQTVNHSPGLARSPRTEVRRCCPDCTPGCQVTGLSMGQAWGHGDDWWGQPFGDDGPNTEAMVFWGDGCCAECEQCPICQDSSGL